MAALGERLRLPKAEEQWAEQCRLNWRGGLVAEVAVQVGGWVAVELERPCLLEPVWKCPVGLK